MKWRIFGLESYDGYTNMAFDEAILQDVMQGGPPTLRFYKWKPGAITLGYNQDVRNEVDIEKCVEDKIICVKRKTGGGTLYHGEEEFSYSYVGPATKFSNIDESYRKICTPLMKALKKLGIYVKIDDKNDVIYEDRKISGSAQVREDGILLQHGTVLWNPSFEKTSRYLNVPLDLEKMKTRVVGVKQIIDITLEELYAKVLEEFLHGKEYYFEDPEVIRSAITHKLAEKKTQSLTNGRKEQWNCYFR